MSPLRGPQIDGFRPRSSHHYLRTKLEAAYYALNITKEPSDCRRRAAARHTGCSFQSSLMLAGSEFQNLGRAIVKEDEYEEVRWDGSVTVKRAAWTIREGPRPTSRLLASRPHAEAEVNDHPTRMELRRDSNECPTERLQPRGQRGGVLRRGEGRLRAHLVLAERRGVRIVRECYLWTRVEPSRLRRCGYKREDASERQSKVRVAGTRSQMENNRTPKALLGALPVGRRKVGRPKFRWLDDVQADLTKVGIRRWRTRALDRSDWSDVLRKAKAKLQGP
ncbi:hypothetical protein ANN_21690 [Periplaneta americana]|uniref:Uncharacterized protein n=1 Tax=Periplaneta americana TaxID=6978 RepID=A0ABQ8S665_PERAM|nr:hypothetical protein ANN_21690 [Periplaneta americana]